MNIKIVKNIGIIISIVGTIVLGYGFYSYNEAQGMIRAITQGNNLFGQSSSSAISIDRWTETSNNCKLILAIGAIILVFGIILLVVGVLINKNKTKSKNNCNNQSITHYETNIQDRLNRLEELKKKQIITEDEYLEKRREIISSL